MFFKEGSMRTIDEDTEVGLRTKVPSWIKAVERAKKDKIDYLITTLDAFLDEPELLYNAVWYAYSHDVPVLIVSKEKQAERS